MSGAPPWLRAMQLEDVAALRKELLQLPDINTAWFAALNAIEYNPLGWAMFFDTHHCRILRCVLDAGADPSKSCCSHSFTNILFFIPSQGIVSHHERIVAQILIQKGAPYKGTAFEPFVKQQSAKNYAAVWCFAKVLPLGARDIAFDFLKRFEELSWGDTPKIWQRIK